MERFARRVGLGVAARGDVADVVGWAVEARDRGLDSLWIHDSYFERDAVSYGSAVAARLGEPGPGDDFRLALGAVNPNTRHPVVLAMTGSALDEMAPGRIVMGLGTGLPLRLKQMGLPYAPDTALEGVSRAMDQMRLLWARRTPAVRHARPATDPADVRPAPPHPPVHRGLPARVRDPRRPEGRRLPGTPRRVDPLAQGHPGATVGGRRRGRPGSREHRAGRLPPDARRRHPPRGAQPRQARAVRHLHDVDPGRRLPQAGRLRARAARPHRRGLAGGGVPRGRQAHPRRPA